MNIICQNILTQDAKDIRIQVFMDEQGFQNEFDEIDDISIHFLGYKNHKPIAVCRIYFDNVRNCYILGRLAIIKTHRKQGYGSNMIEAASLFVKAKGGSTLHLHAQCNAFAFYQRLGFNPYGPIDHDEHCPHRWMQKKL